MLDGDFELPFPPWQAMEETYIEDALVFGLSQGWDEKRIHNLQLVLNKQWLGMTEGDYSFYHEACNKVKALSYKQFSQAIRDADQLLTRQ